MSLCKLLQMDYLHRIGRFNEDREELYTEYDVQFAIAYAEGWLEQGVEIDPVGEFHLDDFLKWCKNKLREIQRPIPPELLRTRTFYPDYQHWDWCARMDTLRHWLRTADRRIENYRELVKSLARNEAHHKTCSTSSSDPD